MAIKDAITLGTILSLLVLLFSLYYKNGEDELQLRLKTVLSGLITIEEKFKINRPRVAVGFGACKDIVFNAKDVLHFSEDYVEQPKHHDAITSLQELFSSFAYYFEHGAAAERFTSNSTLFNELTIAASNLESSQSLIGGNAPSIARRFVWDGCNVLLASTMTSSLKELLPEGLNVVGQVTDRDDIHLIFEYKSGEKWGPYIAPRANRFILHNDQHNPKLNSLEEFGMRLRRFRPHLLIVSGLQMMDNYPMSNDEKRSRLVEVTKQMTSLPHLTKIHFEMASITEEVLFSLIFDNIIPFVDSIGMNEQELANIYSVLNYGNVTLATDSNPRIGKVLDMMRQIYKKIQDGKMKKSLSHPLSRLHVHTLAYQVIIIDKESSWKNTHIAAAKASLVANRYVCDSSKVDIEKSTLVMDESFSVSATPGSRRIYLDARNPVSCWNEQSFEICIAPNLVCTTAKQTAGCGDNISAAGLAAQL